MSLRVCHVCSSHYYDDARIFERQCVSLAEAGYDVHLVANSKASEPFQRRGVTVHPVPVFSSRADRLLRRSQVAEMAAGLQPDLYHVHEPELLGSVLKRAGSRPVVWDVHELYMDDIATKHWIPKPTRPLVRFAWDRWERLLVRRCAAVVPATDFLAPRYRKLHDRVVVLANFPRLPDHAEPTPSSRKANALVFTGTISPYRGVLQTIQAVGILQQRGVSVSFELAGTPIRQEYLDELISEIDRLGVRANIVWHGHLSREQTRQLQQSCGIGMTAELLTPGIQAGYPVKAYEFMMCGLPLIYSDFPIFHSVAGVCDAGIAVDPMQPPQIADAIERLVNDPALARCLGENGKRAVYERFNWNVEWPKLRDLYYQLAGPPHGACGE